MLLTVFSGWLLVLYHTVLLAKSLSESRAFKNCGSDTGGKLLGDADAVDLLGCTIACLTVEAQSQGCKVISFNSKESACKLMTSLHTCYPDDKTQEWQAYKLTSCVDGWVYWKGSCYKIYMEKVNWTIARQNCNNVGAHLTALETTEESNFVWANISQKQQVNIFIGGRDLEEEGVWRWEDGDEDILNDILVHFDDDWRTNEPNNVGNEDCIILEPEGKWSDARCELEFPYVCEYQL